MACRLAASPTIRSPLFVNATTDGVVLFPSEFSSTTGSPPSITPLHELVVSRSIPITFSIKNIFLFDLFFFVLRVSASDTYLSRRRPPVRFPVPGIQRSDHHHMSDILRG